MSYIIERPAGMPDWVEIGIKVMVRDYADDKWQGPYVLSGHDNTGDHPFLTRGGNCWIDAKPYIHWTPKEGEWCAFWQEGDKNFSLRTFDRIFAKRITSKIPGQRASSPWDYCARITNDDGSLIDIRCTVDELKAKTDWLGPDGE